ncbi:MAG: uncharacterized protein KVP18_001654 [Porospora cf. gigantea A]|nr:MAG: hypothetical protein KVP18_001654 [Porospora cf. gigantea A]
MEQAPALDEDVTCHIFPRSWIGVVPCQTAIEAEVRRVQGQLLEALEGHLFAADVPVLQHTVLDQVHCLQVRLRLGDHVPDEWLLVHCLRSISDIWFTTADSDGDFLLVAAADVLPQWLTDADQAKGRVFYSLSSVLIIPPSLKKDAPPLSTALQMLLYFDEECAAEGQSVSNYLTTVFVNLSESIATLTDTDVTFCGLGMLHVPAVLPGGLASLVSAFPSLVILALQCLPPVDGDMKCSDRLYAQRTGHETVPGPAFNFQRAQRACELPSAFSVGPPISEGFLPPPISTYVRMTRFQLARLIGLRVSLPLAYTGTRWGAAQSTPTGQSAAARGAMLAYGLECCFRLNSTSYLRFLVGADEGTQCIPVDTEFREALTRQYYAHLGDLTPTAESLSLYDVNPKLRTDWLVVDGEQVASRFTDKNCDQLNDPCWMDNLERRLGQASEFVDDESSDESSDLYDAEEEKRMHDLFAALDDNLVSLTSKLSRVDLSDAALLEDHVGSSLKASVAMEESPGAGPGSVLLRTLISRK